MADALDGLDDANREAWDLYRTVVTQLAADLHCGGLVLDRLTRHLTDVAFEDTWLRLGILYRTLNPPPAPPKET